MATPAGPAEEKLRTVGIEPGVAWNLGPGAIDFFPRGEPHPWIPVLMRLKGIGARDFASGEKLVGIERLDAWRNSVRVSPLFTEPPPGLRPELQAAFDSLDLVVANVQAPFFDFLNDESLGLVETYIERLAVSPPLPAHSFRDETPAPSPRGSTGEEEAPGPVRKGILGRVLEGMGSLVRGGINFATRSRRRRSAGPSAPAVVVGIIDDGIAFAHENFREPGGGSRVEFFWMQDGLGPPPAGLASLGGLELRKEDTPGRRGIDGLLADCTFANLVDEDELYRRARVLDFPLGGHKAVASRLAHGTHVLDVACGARPDSAQGPDTRIIAVQLPIATTGLPVASTLATNIVSGIFYILWRSIDVAARLGSPPLPVVINISYGITVGPHDGTHIIESAIDAAVRFWRALLGVEIRVVIASGNSHLDRLHAEIALQPGEARDLPLRVQPDDQTPSVVEIWLPASPPPGQSRIEATVVPPGGGATAPLTDFPGGSRTWPAAGPPLCEIASAYYLPPTGRSMFRLTLMPTARIDRSGPVAPPGTWTIRLRNVGPTAMTLDAWIERDEAPFGYPIRGRQSYFDDASYKRYDDGGRPVETDDPASFVRRAGAMNAMATGAEPLVVGAMLRKERRPARYSAGGPTIGRSGPDVVSVGDDSTVHGGVLAAGTRSGSSVALNGTSVAAPAITRWAAERLATGQPSDRAALQAAATALPPPFQSALRAGAGALEPPAHRPPRFER